VIRNKQFFLSVLLLLALAAVWSLGNPRPAQERSPRRKAPAGLPSAASTATPLAQPAVPLSTTAVVVDTNLPSSTNASSTENRLDSDSVADSSPATTSTLPVPSKLNSAAVPSEIKFEDNDRKLTDEEVHHLKLRNYSAFLRYEARRRGTLNVDGGAPAVSREERQKIVNEGIRERLLATLNKQQPVKDK